LLVLDFLHVVVHFFLAFGKEGWHLALRYRRVSSVHFKLGNDLADVLLAQKHGGNSKAANQTAAGPPQPVVHKTKQEIQEAKGRLQQLRDHLDVTAMFLGQENVGKIIAKLEMDAADPPIPQS
jgi:hypothetical protein